jgi:hypothetical protein
MERSAGGNFRNSKEPGQIAKPGDQTGGNGPACRRPVPCSLFIDKAFDFGILSSNHALWCGEKIRHEKFVDIT